VTSRIGGRGRSAPRTMNLDFGRLPTLNGGALDLNVFRDDARQQVSACLEQVRGARASRGARRARRAPTRPPRPRRRCLGGKRSP
jgi:hypothetical protein